MANGRRFSRSGYDGINRRYSVELLRQQTSREVEETIMFAKTSCLRQVWEAIVLISREFKIARFYNYCDMIEIWDTRNKLLGILGTYI